MIRVIADISGCQSIYCSYDSLCGIFAVIAMHILILHHILGAYSKFIECYEIQLSSMNESYCVGKYTHTHTHNAQNKLAVEIFEVLYSKYYTIRRAHLECRDHS